MMLMMRDVSCNNKRSLEAEVFLHTIKERLFFNISWTKKLDNDIKLDSKLESIFLNSSLLQKRN